MDRETRTALVLSGGVSLGAFEAGAYAALDAAGVQPDWVAGSSIGAVTAALVAGTAPADRVKTLRMFWDGMAGDPTPITSFWLGVPAAGPWREAHNQASAVQSFMFGRPGLFRPRLAPGPRAGVDDVSALFDLAPLGNRLTELVDFDRLNGGDIRFSLVATDVESGERVVFDTARGDVIGPRHVLASCALLPVFAPVEIDGRVLGDGGLASNAPLDVVLAEPGADGMTCFVVDLFAEEGSRPSTLGASASRAGDLAFGNQSRRLIEGQAREHRLRAMIHRLGQRLPEEARADPEVAAMLAHGIEREARVVRVAFRAALDEAGPAKSFDFSPATLADRWRAGEDAMRAALAAPVLGSFAPHAALITHG